jgi:hypothetical protein
MGEAQRTARRIRLTRFRATARAAAFDMARSIPASVTTARESATAHGKHPTGLTLTVAPGGGAWLKSRDGSGGRQRDDEALRCAENALKIQIDSPNFLQNEAAKPDGAVTNADGVAASGDEPLTFEVTGFALAEIDVLLDEAREASPDPTHDAEDITPPLVDSALAVTRVGDLWGLGRHQPLCGDSRERETFDRLRGGDRADLVFTDPPYNVPIDRNVCGLGRVRHREFAMAAGEMSSEAFTEFLQATLGHAAASCRDDAIAFVCMDWRHMGELLAAGRTVFSAVKQAGDAIEPARDRVFVGHSPTDRCLPHFAGLWERTGYSCGTGRSP